MKLHKLAADMAPAPAVRGITPYSTPQPPPTVDLFLDGNEGPAPPVDLLDHLRACGPEALRHYPSRGELEAALAARHDVEPAQVLVTAGADEAIDRLCRAFLAPGRELILPVPTFEMFERYAKLAGARVRTIPWRGAAYPCDEVIAAIGDHTAAIAVVSPNNPTGATAAPGDLQRLSEAAPSALLIVDAVYGEFADRDLTSAALRLPNAIVLRSFSKAWGLAGLRVGYVVGAAETVRWLRATGGPYAVSSPSLILVGERLRRGDGSMREYVSLVRRERSILAALLRELTADPAPSQANFVWCRFKNAAWVRDALASLGIWVRSFPGRPALADSLRITCPGDEQTCERLHTALRTALAPEALLFDLDGVLVDVSRSYREAIRLTATEFGVRVTPEEIAAAKAQGDANNDWVVTQRVLAQHGITAPLNDVTRRFEALYQGTAARPGLRENERLIPSPELIARLATRCPLAVVTGRPRADARRFLERFNLTRHFRVVIAQEGAPAKPDPTGVRLALSRLGIRRAWMIGDTPDDILAARAASVIPLGLVAPGDTSGAIRAALTTAGAARVLTELDELEELLP